MTLPSPALSHSWVFWTEMVVLAIVVLVAATLLTLVFNGGALPNPFDVVRDPAPGVWPF